GVVLHVAGPRHVLAEVSRRPRILELRENLLIWLLEDVRHHVEPSAMRHPDQNRSNARLTRFGNHIVENGHEQVEPFDREPRLAGKRTVEESLEDLDLGQTVEQRDRINRIGGRTEAAALGGLSEPLPLFRYEDVRVVVARRGAVQTP